MGFAFFFLFLLFQMLVNYLVRLLIPISNIYSLLAADMVASIIISFVWALIMTPRGYRKTFYKQPAFHKNMLIIFAILIVIDLAWVFLFLR